EHLGRFGVYLRGEAECCAAVCKIARTLGISGDYRKNTADPNEQRECLLQHRMKQLVRCSPLGLGFSILRVNIFHLLCYGRNQLCQPVQCELPSIDAIARAFFTDTLAAALAFL